MVQLAFCILCLHYICLNSELLILIIRISLVHRGKDFCSCIYVLVHVMYASNCGPVV